LINRLEAVLGGVKIVLQNAKTWQLSNPQIVDVEVLTNWIVKRREEFQRLDLQTEIAKLRDLIGKIILFQNQKWEISSFVALKEFKIQIMVKKITTLGKKSPQTLIDNQRKNDPIMKFTPNKAREFITRKTYKYRHPL